MQSRAIKRTHEHCHPRQLGAHPIERASSFANLDRPSKLPPEHLGAYASLRDVKQGMDMSYALPSNLACRMRSLGDEHSSTRVAGPARGAHASPCVSITAGYAAASGMFHAQGCCCPHHALRSAPLFSSHGMRNGNGRDCEGAATCVGLAGAAQSSTAALASRCSVHPSVSSPPGLGLPCLGGRWVFIADGCKKVDKSTSTEDVGTDGSAISISRLLSPPVH